MPENRSIKDLTQELQAALVDNQAGKDVSMVVHWAADDLDHVEGELAQKASEGLKSLRGKGLVDFRALAPAKIKEAIRLLAGMANTQISP